MNLTFHKSFKLQGKSFQSNIELIDFAESISLEIPIFLKEWFDNSSIIKVKTSGSTGVPKEIELQKHYMINSAKATGEFFNLFEGTTALLCMSTQFIAGKMMLVRALTLGWHLDIVEVKSNPLENCDKTFDFAAMVPLQLYNSLSDIEKIKKLIVGGGEVSKEVIKKIKHKKTEIFATYGMTETITHIAVKKLNHIVLEHDILVNPNFQSSYKLFPSIKISLDNRGCLVIDAPTIANELIVTNDLVEILSLNEFNWLGRYDSVINSGGIKLIPEQLEMILSKIVVNRFFMSSLPDTILGEKLIMVVEGKKDDGLFDKIKNSLLISAYQKPKKIYFIEKFVETETLKINRKKTLQLIEF